VNKLKDDIKQDLLNRLSNAIRLNLQNKMQGREPCDGFKHIRHDIDNILDDFETMWNHLDGFNPQVPRLGDYQIPSFKVEDITSQPNIGEGWTRTLIKSDGSRPDLVVENLDQCAATDSHNKGNNGD